MTGPEDFPATDVLRWEQSTVDKAFAELVMGDDNARNAADWQRRLANIEQVHTGREIRIVVVKERQFTPRQKLLIITGINGALWVGIVGVVLAIYATWLVIR